ncbi:alpha/beta hydrolase [Pseudooceanicola aestuarii]|uniref:alpha/beta hydrolase n=1 Tax=Pseudooceanicola aestuarii TaxID=2697319 RepID=UPI0013D8993A|nr:alpha/beta fold hydrolase [Pseudooceanicola aestuarii]
MLTRLITIAGIALTVTAVLPFALILSQPVRASLPETGGLDFSRQIARGAAPLGVERITMRDGLALPVRRVAGPNGAPLLVLVHGSGWHGGQFDGLARRMAEHANVVVPDLRGHGASEGRSGDVDHIGQLEEDLADLIAAEAAPGQKVVLAGHSSGGGLVVRFAGGGNAALIDGAILLAPFLKYNAPTARDNSGGWAHPLTRRIVGLSMLNKVGIHALDHLTVMQFAMPQEVLKGPQGHLARTEYSWRMNTSYAPRGDYLSDVAALPPFLLVAGARDEAFRADQYEPVMSAATPNGRYVLLPGVSHLDVVDAPETTRKMAEFLDEL